MRTTGVIRRIDELGRVVIPKEIRRTMRLRVGEQMEIFVGDDGLVLKKFSGIGNIAELAEEYADALHEVSGCSVLFVDTEKVVSVSGDNKAMYEGKTFSRAVERLLQERSVRTLGVTETVSIIGEENRSRTQVFSPIICGGDMMGGIILLSENNSIPESGYKLTEVATKFFRNLLQ